MAADQGDGPAATVETLCDIVHNILPQLEVSAVQTQAQERGTSLFQLGQVLLHLPALVFPAVGRSTGTVPCCSKTRPPPTSREGCGTEPDDSDQPGDVADPPA